MRLLPRGSGTIYRLLGGYRKSAAWNRFGLRTTRGVAHGFRMRLNLGNTFERETYYLGRFYEWELEHLLAAAVGPGDTFIDVGANIGMITLLAEARVGAEGRVLAFEPNPDARARLKEHVEINGLKNVQAFGVAVGDGPGKATLTTPDVHTSTSTLRHLNQGARTFEVEITTLDSFLDQIPAGRRVFLKIDTEGFDFNVLKGASKLLARPDVIVFSEVNPKWLAELGQTAEQMFAYMAGFGFKPWFVSLENRGAARQMTLHPLALPGPHHWFNALFLRESDAQRLQAR